MKTRNILKRVKSELDKGITIREFELFSFTLCLCLLYNLHSAWQSILVILALCVGAAFVMSYKNKISYHRIILIATVTTTLFSILVYLFSRH
jgi:hypothetical protein